VELVVLIGLPAAGKTSFFGERFAATHVHVSNDLRPRGARRRRDAERREIEDALRGGRSVVVDNTHPRARDRAPLVALGRAHGARVVGYYFEPDVKGSLARNALRSGTGRVPAVAVHVAHKRLEPPSLAEGFDALFALRLAPGGGFEIAPLAGDGADAG
jgi:predicted kinase